MQVMLKSIVDRVFPERHVTLVSLRRNRKVRHLRLPRWVQVAALAGAVGGAGTLIALTADYVDEVGRVVQAKDDEVASKEAEALQAELSNADLRDIATHLQERHLAASRELDQLRARLSTMAAQNSALRGQLYTAELRARNLIEANDATSAQRTEMQQRLAAAEEQLGHQTAQRTGLSARMRHLEAEAATAADLKASLDGAEKRNQQALRDRDAAITERDRLKLQIAQLQRGADVAAAAPPPAN